MIPAELADRVYDFVHLPERHSIHLLVELVEIRTNLLVVIGIVFVVTFVEHSQNGLSIAKVWWMLCNMPFQSFQKFFHCYHLQKFW